MAEQSRPAVGPGPSGTAAAGRPHIRTFKRALTVCMRKPLVLMNTLVARGQFWDPSHAT